MASEKHLTMGERLSTMGEMHITSPLLGAPLSQFPFIFDLRLVTRNCLSSSAAAVTMLLVVAVHLPEDAFSTPLRFQVKSSSTTSANLLDLVLSVAYNSQTPSAEAFYLALEGNVVISPDLLIADALSQENGGKAVCWLRRKGLLRTEASSPAAQIIHLANQITQLVSENTSFSHPPPLLLPSSSVQPQEAETFLRREYSAFVERVVRGLRNAERPLSPAHLTELQSE